MQERRPDVYRLAAGVCLAVLLSCGVQAEDLDGLTVDVLARTGASWNGVQLPEYPRGRPEITVLRIRVPAGASLPIHEHPVINAGVLVRGTLTVVTEDEKTLRLKAGDSIVEVVDTWHSGRNEGDTPAEIVVFYAGTEGEPITLTR